MNARRAPRELPAQTDLLRDRIATCQSITPADQGWLLDALARMPTDEQLCHGDFHPGNVILTSGEPVIIDWADASRGSPAADLARTSLLFLGRIAASSLGEAMSARMSAFHAAYVRRYLHGSSRAERAYQSWLPFVAAARLSEGISEQRDWLITQVHVGIAAARAAG